MGLPLLVVPLLAACSSWWTPPAAPPAPVATPAPAPEALFVGLLAEQDGQVRLTTCDRMERLVLEGSPEVLAELIDAHRQLGRDTSWARVRGTPALRATERGGLTFDGAFTVLDTREVRALRAGDCDLPTAEQGSPPDLTAVAPLRVTVAEGPALLGELVVDDASPAAVLGAPGVTRYEAAFLHAATYTAAWCDPAGAKPRGAATKARWTILDQGGEHFVGATDLICANARVFTGRFSDPAPVARPVVVDGTEQAWTVRPASLPDLAAAFDFHRRGKNFPPGCDGDRCPDEAPATP